MKFTRTGIAALAVLVIAATALVLTSIGSAQAEPKATPFKMAIVTDIGSLQDRSFNQLANEGRKAVGKKLGIPTRVYETHSAAERMPNMLAASKAGYNLIFAVGFLNYTRSTPSRRSSRSCGTRASTRTTRCSARSRRTPPASSSPSTRPATSSATSPGSRRRRRSSTPSAPWARTTCPRSSATSAATSRARRRRTRGSRCSRTTRTTRPSTIRRSATRRR